VPVSIDLNWRAALWGERDPRPVIEPLVDGCELLIGNAIAVQAMLTGGATNDATAAADGGRELAERLAAKYRTRRVALTRRVIVSEREHHWSAALFDAATRTFAQSRTHRVDVVDRVGGGDSFAAALIASLHQHRPLDHALEFAVAASAHKLTVPGDWLRLTSDDIERLVTECN
jgi:2-dehydro-3-deoxygluconokinase